MAENSGLPHPAEGESKPQVEASQQSEAPKPTFTPPPEASKLPCEEPMPPPTSDKLKRVICIASVACFILSLPLLASGISLLYMRDYNCENFIHMPEMRIMIGVAMILIFIISNLVIYYGSRCLMPGLLAATIPLMVMFIVGLALVGAYKMESRAVPDSPMWLQLRVDRHGRYWNDIKACLYRTQVCAELGFRMMGLTSYAFSTKKLTGIESGCCKPPSFCGMEYVNATCWINARESKEYQELEYASKSVLGGDCSTWDNAQNKLCYDCESCKEGFLRTLQQRWKRLGIFLVLMAVLLIATHASIFVTNLADMKTCRIVRT
ncbi:tetraspanin-15-like [Aristolochia californica]|uniref:tetraspanin-15-like n=1 Tax=Aristolochia californica TaxID=171875 RepID=UPI0035D70EC0